MIASQITLLESFVILYATLISAVHRIIGNEFGKSYLCARVRMQGLTMSQVLRLFTTSFRNIRRLFRPHSTTTTIVPKMWLLHLSASP